MQDEPDQQERQVENIDVERVQRISRGHEVADEECRAESPDQPREDRRMLEPRAGRGGRRRPERLSVRFAEIDAEVGGRPAVWPATSPW